MTDGADLIVAAQQLVLDALKSNREGLTNSEVDERTNLNLPISKQRGYITWTILQYLLETGRVTKEGRRYVAI